MKYTKYYLLTLSIIIIDQAIKLTVYKTFPYEGYYIPVLGNWFKLHYITNPGMAFGIEIGSQYGKMILTIFRLVAMVVIGIYLYRLAKKDTHPGLLWCIGGILGGAIGNVVDSTFYGALLGDDLVSMIYDPGTKEMVMPPTPWFHGKVIDMFYIDICNCYIPSWVPIFGGEYYALWPIFNFADASIFVSVCIIVIFQKKFFKESEKK
ncbi:MAG: lipoprotein signal peptidase [Cytophagaceae bacterium]|nr:lipoprotein signal peptidase [Cytophagaceae bacterium]MDW8456106.1 lipoprotein signal peptidase [Cytophagaceae bacterium]